MKIKDIDNNDQRLEKQLQLTISNTRNHITEISEHLDFLEKKIKKDMDFNIECIAYGVIKKHLESIVIKADISDNFPNADGDLYMSICVHIPGFDDYVEQPFPKVNITKEMERSINSDYNDEQELIQAKKTFKKLINLIDKKLDKNTR